MFSMHLCVNSVLLIKFLRDTYSPYVFAFCKIAVLVLRENFVLYMAMSIESCPRSPLIPKGKPTRSCCKMEYSSYKMPA